jgi:hypothetical protein
MMAQTLTWQGAYVVAELGITAPRTKPDDDGRLIDDATLEAIAAVTDALLRATAMAPGELAALAAELSTR